jgi:hypothetical protein
MSRRLIPACLLFAGLCSPVAASPAPSAVVPLRLHSGRPVVDGVYVNGHGPYRFLVDTGATMNHIDPKLALSIGLSSTFETKLMGPNGTTTSKGHEGGEVRLGEVTADRQVFLFSGMDLLHEVAGDAQGVLGQVFLSQFDYRLDLEHGRLEFGRVGFDGVGTLAAFHKSAEQLPVVSTSLGAMVLDSGAHAVVRFRVRAVNATQEFVGATGATPTGTVDSKLAIRNHTFWSGDAMAVPHTPQKDVDGLIPLSLFKSVYVNNSESYVVLK